MFFIRRDGSAGANFSFARWPYAAGARCQGGYGTRPYAVGDDACIVPHTELQPWYTVINILSPRRAFLFSTRSPSICGKPFRFFSLFPVVTRSAFLFLPTNCPCSRKVYRNFQLFHALFIRSSFLFFMIESIGGPYYRPQLEELLCTKPNSRATPKRRPALYMP